MSSHMHGVGMSHIGKPPIGGRHENTHGIFFPLDLYEINRSPCGSSGYDPVQTLAAPLLRPFLTDNNKGNGANGEVERLLIEDVQTAVRDMVELIKTYRSKRRISQVIVSTMFKRRMDEMEAVIDRAISDLNVSLFRCRNATTMVETEFR